MCHNHMNRNRSSDSNISSCLGPSGGCLAAAPLGPPRWRRPTGARPVWCGLGPSGAVWGRLAPSGAVWGRLGRSGAAWGRRVPSGAFRGRLGPSGAVWGPVWLSGAVWELRCARCCGGRGRPVLVRCSRISPVAAACLRIYRRPCPVPGAAPGLVDRGLEFVGGGRSVRGLLFGV